MKILNSLTSFYLFIGLIVVAIPVQSTWAQDSIFRCGNEYTNNAVEAKERGCKTLQGGNITIVPATKIPVTLHSPVATSKSPSTASASSPAGSPKVDPADQRTRDTNAKAILDSELRRTEARLTELQKEYNNGEPDKMGAETRNHQKYLDRVTELKAAISRNEEDVAGIKREMARYNR
jgi:hypothetical protein